MTRKAFLGCMGLAIVLGALGASVPVAHDALHEVRVTNFPDVQPISGSVTLNEPIPRGVQLQIPAVIVPPVPKSSTTRIIDAGRIDMRGYPRVRLSLAGEIKGQVTQPGVVGAVLVPDEPLILEAFEEKSRYFFSIEALGALEAGDRNFFAGSAVEESIGFDAYRLYFYNSSNKTVEANLFAYLTD